MSRTGRRPRPLNRFAMRLLAVPHALGVNAAIVAGLILTPPVVAVGYLTNSGQAGGAPIPPAALRGSFDAFADDAAHENARAVDGLRRPDGL